MNFNEMYRAVEDARGTLRAADAYVDKMADLIRGKLRSCGVSVYTLMILKRELQDFDMRNKCWKDK